MSFLSMHCRENVSAVSGSRLSSREFMIAEDFTVNSFTLCGAHHRTLFVDCDSLAGNKFMDDVRSVLFVRDLFQKKNY